MVGVIDTINLQTPANTIDHSPVKNQLGIHPNLAEIYQLAKRFKISREQQGFFLTALCSYRCLSFVITNQGQVTKQLSWSNTVEWFAVLIGGVQIN